MQETKQLERFPLSQISGFSRTKWFITVVSNYQLISILTSTFYLQKVRPQAGQSTSLTVSEVLHQHDYFLHTASNTLQQSPLQIMEVNLEHIRRRFIECYGHKTLEHVSQSVSGILKKNLNIRNVVPCHHFHDPLV